MTLVPLQLLREVVAFGIVREVQMLPQLSSGQPEVHLRATLDLQATLVHREAEVCISDFAELSQLAWMLLGCSDTVAEQESTRKLISFFLCPSAGNKISKVCSSRNRAGFYTFQMCDSDTMSGNNVQRGFIQM